MLRGRFGTDPKLCPRCKHFFARADYPKNKTRPGGINSYCKKCTALQATNWRDKSRFSGQRTKVLKRDNFMCVKCGMTDIEHLKKFGRHITIDHKDRKGSGVPVHLKNNNLDNLQTLCMPCHAEKDNISLPVILSIADIVNIRHMKGAITRFAVAQQYNISQHTVRNIWFRPFYRSVVFENHRTYQRRPH